MADTSFHIFEDPRNSEIDLLDCGFEGDSLILQDVTNYSNVSRSQSKETSFKPLPRPSSSTNIRDFKDGLQPSPLASTERQEAVTDIRSVAAESESPSPIKMVSSTAKGQPRKSSDADKELPDFEVDDLHHISQIMGDEVDQSWSEVDRRHEEVQVELPFLKEDFVGAEPVFQIRSPDEESSDGSVRARAGLIDWFVSVQWSWGLHQKSLFLAVNLLDRYLSIATVAEDDMQLVGAVVLYLAAKCEEENPPREIDLLYLVQKTGNPGSLFDFLEIESHIVSALENQICVPTIAHELLTVQQANGCDDQSHVELSNYILEVSVMDVRMMRYPASHLAAAGMLLSNELFGTRRAWTTLLEQQSTYIHASISKCAKEMHQLLCKAPTSHLQSVRKKYLEEEKQCVADSVALMLCTDMQGLDGCHGPYNSNQNTKVSRIPFSQPRGISVESAASYHTVLPESPATRLGDQRSPLLPSSSSARCSGSTLSLSQGSASSSSPLDAAVARLLAKRPALSIEIASAEHSPAPEPPVLRFRPGEALESSGLEASSPDAKLQRPVLRELFYAEESAFQAVEEITMRRAAVLTWLVELQMECELHQKTLVLAINLMDRYLAVAASSIMEDDWKLIGLAAMLIAARYKECSRLSLTKLVSIAETRHAATSERDFLRLEGSILSALDYWVAVPTASDFLQDLQQAHSCAGPHHVALANYILELALIYPHMIEYPPSYLAAGSLSLSSQLLEVPFTLRSAKYKSDANKLESCVQEMRNLLRLAPSDEWLSVVRRKYMKAEHHAVASMPCVTEGLNVCELCMFSRSLCADHCKAKKEKLD
eukprot:TRINITY_DN3311_c4_g1_i1.p1 TRINITY_DN3311_c4_g1~~TRINITY_DN3311_c4_g1_i1.p1  ORF type:complete len:825 (+),score=161.70 TRINITY_DN3311_c4_g1_i1:79-2553(+)